MRVAVYGTWYKKRAGFGCEGTEEEFRAAGRQLGELLAETRRQVIITSFGQHTLDRHVAAGYIDWLNAQAFKPSMEQPPLLYIKFDRPQEYKFDEDSDEYFAEISHRTPSFITSEWAQGRLRFDRHLAGLKKADTVVVVGGADHSFMAGQFALLAGKPLIPVGSFGGAGETLLRQILPSAMEPERALLGQLAGPGWSNGALDATRRLLSGFRIAIIHGHGTDWMEARDIVQQTSSAVDEFTPLVMKEMVRGAEALPHKWEAVAGEADAAVAVVTPDDLGGAVRGASLSARARQNVWLEIGWIWGRLGRSKLLILIRQDVDIPSDFLGVEYHTYQHKPAERTLEIRAFLRRLL